MSELSRKRPYTDDGDITVAKKRVLTGANGTPHVNGHSDQTEDEQIFQANLEKFRKEAIYRKMKEYHRESERNLARIMELERRKTTCEAGLAAMTACWAQLIETIRLFVKSDDLYPSAIQAKDVYDIRCHVEKEAFPELREALDTTSNATEALVNKLIGSGGTDRSLVFNDSQFSRLQQSQTECAALRSQLGILTKQLEDCTLEKDKYHTDLVAVENRIERSQSETVQAVHPKISAAKPSPKDSETEDTERKPSSPSIPPTNPSNASTPGPEGPAQIALLPESVRIWEGKIAELEKENFALKKELLERPADNQQPSPAYQHDLAVTKRLNSAAINQAEKAQEELQQVCSSREEWQRSVLVSQEQVLEGLKAMVVKRDVENTRLREQRDQANAELLERRQKDGFKWSAMQEQKQLSAAHVERLTILQSELSRCKAWLAAEERNEDLLHFFLQGKPDEAELIEQLRKAKQDAEIRAEAAENSLSDVLKDQPDRAVILTALTEAEDKALKLSAELDELKKTFGDSCVLPLDVSKLNDHILSQAAELDKLRLHRIRHEKAEGDLFKELEKLSTAWETLEKQVKSKAFDLHHLEEKLSKSIVEKAKSENKYYAAMRDREAGEAERKVLQRTLDKLYRVVDVSKQKEETSEKLGKALEQELNLEKKLRVQTVQKMSELEDRRLQLESRLHDLGTKCSHHTEVYAKQHEVANARESTSRMREEEWVRQKRGLEEQIQRLKQEAATRAVHNHSSKDDSEYQHMRSLLLCSTCETNFRAVIITKCMHTFCKPCIDARISTRQRKCPACNVQFAQSDVSTLYMQ